MRQKDLPLKPKKKDYALFDTLLGPWWWWGSPSDPERACALWLGNFCGMVDPERAWTSASEGAG
ncbi:MAG: hypothetical protein VX252_03160 [Myxococcota bacterium]|nr:hypothetical protein [Myxococcota bacterium]